jgi:hypothetical protein
MPKRISARLDEQEFLALITAGAFYMEQSPLFIGQEAVDALDAHLRGAGRMDFAFVRGRAVSDLPPHQIDQAQTYFYLELALRQLQADVDRLRGQG